MKKYTCILIAVLVIFSASGTFAFEPTDEQQRVWELCALNGFVSQTLSLLSAMPLSYRSTTSINTLIDWVLATTGNSGSIGYVFSRNTYQAFLSFFEGWGNKMVPNVIAGYAAPSNCVKSGSDIQCDDVAGLTLFSFNSGTRVFTDTEISPSGGVFTNPGAGNFVVATMADGMCTQFISLP